MLIKSDTWIYVNDKLKSKLIKHNKFVSYMSYYYIELIFENAKRSHNLRQILCEINNQLEVSEHLLMHMLNNYYDS